MDLKTIGIYTGIFVGSFILIFTATYFLYPYINPDQVQQVQKQFEMQTDTPFEEDISNGLVQSDDSLQPRVDSLSAVIDSLHAVEASYEETADSLASLLEDTRSELETVRTKYSTIVSEGKEIEAVSKSVLSMDEESMSPIVNLLSEKQLVKLYNTASRMQKEKLLRALDPNKAANILKKVML